MHNVRVPGMLHGRVVRPRGQGAYGGGARRSLSVDESSIKHIPDAQVVAEGNFLGVVAPTEYDAIQAAAQLKVTWADHAGDLPGSGNLVEAMRDHRQAGQAPARYAVNTGNVDTALAVGGERRLRDLLVPLQRARADRPDLRGRGRDDATARGSCSQHRRTCYALRSRCRTLARLLELPENQIRVQLLRGLELLRRAAPQNDAAEAAARAVAGGRRAGARSSSCAGTSTAGTTTARRMLIDIRGGVDANGKIVATRLHPRSGSVGDHGRPPELQIGLPEAGVTYGRPATAATRTQRHAVQRPEPPRDREVAAAPEQLLQVARAAGAERAADVLRATSR